MTGADRFKNWIDEVAQFWADRLKAWLVTVLSFGLEIFLDVIGKAFAPKLKPLIEELEKSEDIPDWILPILKEIKEPTGEVGAFLAQSAGGALVGGAIGSVLDAMFMRFAYSINSKLHPRIANEQQLLAFWLRGFYTDEKLKEELRKLGADDSAVSILKELAHVKLNPDMVMKLWLRDKKGYEHLWKELTDSGVPQHMIPALKELAHVMPTPAELVLWTAKEAFEEDAVKKYGLDDEYGKLDLSWFEKVGVKPEHAKLNWRAHWVHPAFREMTDMLHRGEITDADLYDWYRLVEIPPHWRDKLTAISWDLPNRIELRMMARYGLVDKAFLVKQLELVGLREDFRSIAADMMLAMGIRTDLSTRYSKGWLDAEGVKAELKISGLSPDVADRMYMWIVKNVAPERVVKERDLTLANIYKGIRKGSILRPQGFELIKAMGYDDFEVGVMLSNNAPEEETVAEVRQRLLSKADILKAYKLNEFDKPEAIRRLVEQRFIAADAEILTALVDRTRVVEPDEKVRELTKIDIIKAVKAGVLTPEEGYIMLQDVGYTPKDAEIIFQTRVEAEAGSPDTFGEFNNIVQSYRAAIGLPSKATPPEVILAEREVKATQAALDAGKAEKVKPKRMAELERAVEDAKIAYHQLSS